MTAAGADGGWDRGFGALTVKAISGGIGGGTFTVTAGALTTISNVNISSVSNVIVAPNNPTAGLLAQTKSYYVSGIGAGFFTFVVSATGANAPDGTEVFQYIFLRET